MPPYDPLVPRYAAGSFRGAVSAAAQRRRPGQLVILGFLGAIGLGTLLLMLPVATTGRRATFMEALFTATSATCVTGLVVTDTPVFWTPFGHVVILVLILVGGLGVMTVASVVGLLLVRRIGLGTRMVAAASTRSIGLGDVKSVLLNALRLAFVVQSVVAVLVAVRLATAYGEPPLRALWLGTFHAISAYNNAGFALWSDSLMGFVGDPWMLLPLSAAVIIGGLGLPVIMEVVRTWRSKDTRKHRWSSHTVITTWMTAALLAGGTLFFLFTERSNPATLGPLSAPDRILAAFTQSVMARTAGFNSLDTAAMHAETWLGTDVLMFIGAGSAGTAGGIKVTTFGILGLVIWSELRGDPDVTVARRRVGAGTQRQALTVALLGIAAVVLPTIWITATSPFHVDNVMFEVISAFSTTGLSTGITADLAPAHQLTLVVLMFVGRLGPITVGAALALRERARLFRYPETNPIVG